MSFKTLGAALLTLLLLGGCAAEQSRHYTVSQQAIKGGYTDEVDKAVVGLVMFVGQGYGTCSGTLITPNMVLTAQHCIAPVTNEVQGGVVCGYTSFGSAYNGDQIIVTTDTQLSQDANNYYNVAEVITPPGDGLCGYDIALLVLSDAVPESEAIPFAPRVDSPIIADPAGLTTGSELYSAVGYGNTNDSWGWGGGGGSGERRRLDNLYTFCEGSQCGEPEYIYETEWMGDTGVCQGDSGGPALDSASRVIGVVSRGSQGCTSPVYTSVFGWRDWIMGVVADRSAETGQPVPGWATGGATDTTPWPIGDPCEDNADCFSGLCNAGECTRACSDEALCPEGYTCHPEDAICVAPPVGPPCSSDADCDGGVCFEGMCTRPCSGESCPENYTCDEAESLCLPVPLGQPCESALDCDTGLCIGGLCSRLCDVMSPCPAPFGCDQGLCQLPDLGSVCVIDEDCAGGQCLNGSCTRACDEFPCDAPWVCDDSFLVCVEPPAPSMPDCEVEPCEEDNPGQSVDGGELDLEDNEDEARGPLETDPETPVDEVEIEEDLEGINSGNASDERTSTQAIQELGDGSNGGAQSGGCQGSEGPGHWPAALLGLGSLIWFRRERMHRARI
mgnify:CR=1 FL=1